jgi:oligoribonuclease
MPKLIDHLHYRIIDVSSIKQIIKMWYNGNPPYKKLNHRAMDDIYESLEELKYYKKNHFIK